MFKTKDSFDTLFIMNYTSFERVPIKKYREHSEELSISYLAFSLLLQISKQLSRYTRIFIHFTSA